MEDKTLDKKVKLANTKKRFKELQDLKKKRQETNETTDLNNSTRKNDDKITSQTPAMPEVINSFNAFSINNDNNMNNPQSSIIHENVTVPNNAPSVANYFADSSQKTSTFFDDFYQTNSSAVNLTSSNFNQTNQTQDVLRDGNNKNFDSNTTAESPQEKYSLFPKDNDSKFKSGSSDANQSLTEDPVAIGFEAAVDFYQKNLENVISSSDTQKLLDYLSPNRNNGIHVNSNEINQEIDNFTDITKKEISNVENIKQFTEIQQSNDSYKQYGSSSSITDLEKRNIELVSYLEKEKINSQQLQVINNQLQSRLLELDKDSRQQENDENLTLVQNIEHLKQELQAHSQTISLLIAEKTELATNLNQYELNYKQKNKECEELQTRLKASRARVADLERELHCVRIDRDKSESVDEQHIIVINNLKKEYSALKAKNEELDQDSLEIREKLKNSADENIKLQLINKDLSGKLSLADIKIQQLSSEGSSVANNKIEELMKSTFVIQNENNNLNLKLQSVIKEKEDLTVQYQQYAQQLNEQMATLSKELHQLQQTKETLLLQEQNRIKHISELEKQLQSFTQKNEQKTSNNDDQQISRLQSLEEEYKTLQLSLKNLENNYAIVTHNNKELLEELTVKTDLVTRLQNLVDQLKGNQPDSVKLLQVMESDKIAASKAIQQNKELKEQLESMQEVFRKLDNDKVELTENYHAQQQTNKDLVEKLKKMENSIQSLTVAIDIKDKELSRLMEEHSNEESGHNHEHEHKIHEQDECEVKTNTHAVEHELVEAKEKIKRLTNELLHLKHVGDNDNKSKDDPEEIITLEKEAIDSIKQPKVIDEKNTSDAKLDKEMAVKYLESKVTRTMKEIADLTDEKQRLEHIILQLQTETEVIGEYVALYQHQRMMLKQKTIEKDQQFKQLANDREQVKMKLDQLNHLIKKLVSKNPCVIKHEVVNELNHQSDTMEKIENRKISYSETEKTVNEIDLLLSDIKMSNLIQADENFHHCPSCSGNLITI